MEDLVMTVGCAARERAAVVVDALEGALMKALFLQAGEERREAIKKLRKTFQLYLHKGPEGISTTDKQKLLMATVLLKVIEWLEKEEGVRDGQQMGGLDGEAAADSGENVQRCCAGPVGIGCEIEVPGDGVGGRDWVGDI